MGIHLGESTQFLSGFPIWSVESPSLAFFHTLCFVGVCLIMEYFPCSLSLSHILALIASPRLGPQYSWSSLYSFHGFECVHVHVFFMVLFYFILVSFDHVCDILNHGCVHGLLGSHHVYIFPYHIHDNHVPNFVHELCGSNCVHDLFGFHSVLTFFIVFMMFQVLIVFLIYMFFIVFMVVFFEM